MGSHVALVRNRERFELQHDTTLGGQTVHPDRRVDCVVSRLLRPYVHPPQCPRHANKYHGTCRGRVHDILVRQRCRAKTLTGICGRDIPPMLPCTSMMYSGTHINTRDIIHVAPSRSSPLFLKSIHLWLVFFNATNPPQPRVIVAKYTTKPAPNPVKTQ